MDSSQHGRQPFVPTRWSVVLAAGQADSPAAREALSTLCQTYWYPLYAYVRRQGYSPHDAQDLTQEFFARLLERRYLDGLKREGGRFRSFLLTALKRFLSNQAERARAQKRGGGQVLIPIDAESAETRYRLEPGHELTAEKIYEQRWAQALLDLVLRQLREEYTGAGKSRVLEEIAPSLSQRRGTVPYAEIAARLGTTEPAIKMAVQRLRARYRELLRAEIAHTVDRPEEVEEEIRHLFTMFG